MRVNIPGGPHDVARESEDSRRPVAAISPFSRDNKPIDNEVVIHRDRDPRLRNQSMGSPQRSADETLRFPNGQAVLDGPLNTCDAFSASEGRNQCHIAKGNICKSFEEKWENRESKMAGIGIGKYPEGDVKDQTKTDLFDKDEIWRKKKCLKGRQNYSDSSKWKPAIGQPHFDQSNRLAPVQPVQPTRSVATIPGSSHMTVHISSPYQPTNSPYQSTNEYHHTSESYKPVPSEIIGGIISDSGSEEDWFDIGK